MAISVAYKVLSDGYQIMGDAQSGYSASVPYLVTWANAFTFVNEMLGRTSASTVGPVTYYLPYRFPTTSGVSLYATSFEMEPCGSDGSAVPNKGLLPGEFFSHAKVTVQFTQPENPFDGTVQDPNGLNQLDPAEPITVAVGTVDSRGKVVTQKGGGYEFSDGKPLLGDFGRRVIEADVVLEFPKVPYLPWGTIQGAYIGRVNSTRFLNVPRGQLLLEVFRNRAEKQNDGKLCQAITLGFKYQDYEWNKQPRPDTGALDAVTIKGSGDPIYPYVEFRNLLNVLKYSTVTT